MEQQPKFEHWCIVELFGHQKIAGLVTEESLFGGSLMRVDVPGTDASEPFTKYYGNSAIYAITPVSQDVAIAFAKALNKRPVSEWEIPTKMIPASTSAEEEYDDADYDEDSDREYVH